MLFGWAAGIRWLKDPVGAFVDMKPLPAIMRILAGLSLELLTAPESPSRLRLGAARALAVGCASLAVELR